MDVAAWLQDLGLERYVSAFRDNARGRSFGYYLNNAKVEHLENMTFTELSCELPDHAGWRQTAS